VLQDNGVLVYFGNTDAWGSVRSNASLLQTTISEILENGNHERVNIIAHSKGGIDSRYFIWKYDFADRVASLTTVSTPHRGAEIADLLYATRLMQTEPERNRLRFLGRIFGDVNPDIHEANRDLTTENMKEFNENVFMDERVFFQSIYSVMNDSSHDPFYAITHAYINRTNGENDGLVSAFSARWGENTIRLPYSLSHRQIIDHEREAVNGIDIPNIFLEIVRDLSVRGF